MSQSFYWRLARRYGEREAGLSRRTVLKAAMAAGGALLLGACGSSPVDPFVQGSPSARRVIVIGAGFAGLSCAYALRSAGYAVLVIEARDRVGGRVITLSDVAEGKIVEGGGEFVGKNHPTWQAYARLFGLELQDATEDENLEKPLCLEGKTLDADAARKLYQEMTEALATLEGPAEVVNADEPWKSAEAAVMDSRTMADWLAWVNPSPLAKRALRAELEARGGVGLKKQSYLGQLALVKGGGGSKYWTESEAWRAKGGNQSLATKLYEAIGAAHVMLKTRVVSVVTGNQGVFITTDNGQRFMAEDVVLATPASVWSKIRLAPELPEKLLPQIGSHVKYISAVRRRFWKDVGMTARGLTDGPINQMWEATSGQAGEHSAALTCLSGGNAVARVRAIPEAQRDAFFAAEIAKIFPDYAENRLAVRYVDWTGDEWARGGRCVAAPGEITAMGETLYHGIGRLHFAGDFACWKFAGSMEGALTSGASVAQRLALRDGVIRA